MSERDETVAQFTPWALVPEWVVDHPTLSDGAVRCYAVLARIANSEHRLWPSQKQLAERMHRTEKTVRGYLQELKEVKALAEVKRRFGASTIHVLHVDPPEKQHVATSSVADYRTANADAESLQVAPSSVENYRSEKRVEASGPSSVENYRKDRKEITAQFGKNLPTNESQLTRATEREPTGAQAELALVGVQPKAAKKKRAGRDSDDSLAIALAAATETNLGELTNFGADSFFAALAQIRATGATPEDIGIRAINYRASMPQARCTAFALAKHWASLGGDPLASRPSAREIDGALWAARKTAEKRGMR